jgi:chromosome partitioning protein
VTSTVVTHRPGPVGWPAPITPDVLPVAGTPTPVGWFGTQTAGERPTEDIQDTETGESPSRHTESSEDEPVTELDASRTRIRSVLDDAVGSSVPATEEFDTPIMREAAQAVRVRNTSGENSFPRPTHRRVITVANQKGGVGKTTSTVNLAVALSMHGLRVLVIDLDPQGNASTGLGVGHGSGTPSIYEALVDGMPLDEAAVPVEQAPNLWCVPATIDLAGAEIELVSVVAREHRLRRAIAAYGTEVDYILVDCPPSLGLLTVNALVAGDEVLIPIQCEYYALEGLGQLLSNIDLIKSHLNGGLQVSTILLTMYDGRTKLADQVAQEVRRHFGDLVLDVVIPRSVRVSEAPGYGQSVMTYDPGSRGALTYFEAARELADRGTRLAPVPPRESA